MSASALRQVRFSWPGCFPRFENTVFLILGPGVLEVSMENTELDEKRPYNTSSQVACNRVAEKH